MTDRSSRAGTAAVVVALIAAAGTYISTVVIDADLARREQLSLTLQEVVKVGLQMEEIKRDVLLQAYQLPPSERAQFLDNASQVFGRHIEGENKTLFHAARILHQLALQHEDYEAAFDAAKN